MLFRSHREPATAGDLPGPEGFVGANQAIEDQIVAGVECARQVHRGTRKQKDSLNCKLFFNA